MRKGQTAMEYLMTYGWAILIILIVGGLLVYYGVFSIKPGTSKQGFGMVDVSSPWDYKITSTNTVNLTFRVENRVGQPITITGVSVTDPATGTGSQTTTTYPSPMNVPLAPGQISQFIGAEQTLPAGAGNIGDPYSIKVVISYKISDQTFTVSGILGGTKS